MATHSGSVDPGLLLWLIEQTGMTEAGSRTRSSTSRDCSGWRGQPTCGEVVARSAAGDEEARLALDGYLHLLRAGIAAMAATLGGLDALAFTGGVGENNPVIQPSVGAGLAFLGVEIDPELNRSASGDCEITHAHGVAGTLVVHAREDLEIAGQVRRLLEQ